MTHVPEVILECVCGCDLPVAQIQEESRLQWMMNPSAG